MQVNTAPRKPFVAKVDINQSERIRGWMEMEIVLMRLRYIYSHKCVIFMLVYVGGVI